MIAAASAVAIARSGEDMGERLAPVRDRFAQLAAGIDARFVAAGTALADQYTMVEQLIAVLEGVTGAMQGHDGRAATDRLRHAADTLTALPMVQEARRIDLDAIATHGRALASTLDDVRKTLDLLRVYGLNVQVEAAETGGFTDFAQQMDAKLDHSDAHVAALTDALRKMIASIPAAHRTAARLLAEAATVIPAVPRRLGENVVALERYRTELAEAAARIAGIARTIHGLVAEAIGALQIGDITRQRLEHIVDGAQMLAEPVPEDADADAIAAARARIATLLAAQATDTADQFDRDAGVLIDRLRRIMPEAQQLLATSRSVGGSDGTDAGGSFLRRLEVDIAEMATVTVRLREADDEVATLAAAISAAGEAMVCRLAQIRRARRDVQLLALNAGFRSMRVGVNSRGLTVVTAHIHDCANILDRQVDQIDAAISRLAQSAASLRERREDVGIDVGHALSSALAAVHAGAAHTDAVLARAGDGAAKSLAMLQATVEEIDCDDQIATPLADTVAAIVRLTADDDGAPLTGDAEAAYQILLARMAALYTMAREREVHRGCSGEEEPVEVAADADDDDFDGALF